MHPTLKVSNGNRKIGEDTLILNMNAAMDCPSRKRGLCPLENPKRCYALKAERLYPQVLPYRRKQEAYWKATDAENIAQDLMAQMRLVPADIKYLRFSESGDFEAQEDVDKMVDISTMLVDNTDVIVYGYTARHDLDFSNRPKNMVVTGSGFMLDNMFMTVDSYSEDAEYKCPGNCRVCSMCKVKKERMIEVELH
jgi:hypothetical protein